MEDVRRARRGRVLWGAGLGVTLVAVTISAVLSLFHAVQPLLPSTPDPTTRARGAAAPSSSPTSAGPRRGSDLRLPGAGGDIVYVQADAAVYRIDLATGQMARTLTPELTQFSSLVAGREWLVSKTVDNDTGVVVRSGRPAAPLPAGLLENGRIYPAGPDQLWLVPEDATNGYRTAVKVDLDGHRVGTATIKIPDEFGTPDSDQAGDLLITNAGGAYEARPDRLRRLGSGQLLAGGTRYVLTWDCDDHARCNAYRTDRVTQRATLLAANHQAVVTLYQGDQNSTSSQQGVLSPDGTHAALGTPPRGSVDSPLAVLDLATGRHILLPGTMTDTNPNAQIAWTANSRWLLALTDHQLRAYDTTTGTVRTLHTGAEPLQHLVSGSTATGF